MNKKTIILISNLILSLLLGLAFYLVLSPHTLIADAFYGITQLTRPVLVGQNKPEVLILQLLRGYASDMLWAYALTIAVWLVLWESRYRLLLSWGISISGATLMEAAQLSPAIHATFDGWDIIVEIIAGSLAAVIIYFITRETRKVRFSLATRVMRKG